MIVRINENAWQPSQVKTMTGLPSEQVLELVDRVEDYLGGWHPSADGDAKWNCSMR
jgi:hypothetical protein